MHLNSIYHNLALSHRYVHGLVQDFAISGALAIVTLKSCDKSRIWLYNWYMMTSSNGNIFLVTGHFCGEFTGDKGQWRGALMFYLICTWINGCINNREAGDLRRHRAHYDVAAMTILYCLSNIFICTTSSMCRKFYFWKLIYLQKDLKNISFDMLTWLSILYWTRFFTTCSYNVYTSLFQILNDWNAGVCRIMHFHTKLYFSCIFRNHILHKYDIQRPAWNPCTN